MPNLRIRTLLRKLAMCSALPLVLVAGYAHSAPIIQSVSVIIDKPDYSSSYAVGVTAYVDGQGVDIAEVSVTHTPTTSGSLDSWPLQQTSASQWWNWSTQRVPLATGPIDGTLSVSVTDVDSQTTTIQGLQFYPAAELDFPVMTVQTLTTGYRVNTTNVPNADYYDLWLWDPIALIYPSSQQVTDVADLLDIPFDGLVDGRSYSIFLIANNLFQTEETSTPYTYHFRSYTQQRVSFEAASIPEPETLALLMSGLGLILAIARRRPQGAVTGG